MPFPRCQQSMYGQGSQRRGPHQSQQPAGQSNTERWRLTKNHRSIAAYDSENKDLSLPSQAAELWINKRELEV